MTNWWRHQERWKLLYSATISTWLPISQVRTYVKFHIAISIILLGISAPSVADILDNYRSDAAVLSGKIWDTKERRFISLESFIKRLEPGNWLLLGETHENPDHHRFQTELIEYLAQRDQLGAVALEMAQIEQQPLLDAAQQKITQTVNAEITALSLEWQAGWPWEWYQAPVTAALRFAEKVVATDLTREAKMRAYKDTTLEVPASQEYQRFMLDLLYESHCGQMPKEQLVNMLRVQYARDKSMLNTMKENTNQERVNILLAGTVHTRYDVGIPYWPESPNSITLLLIATNASNDVADYYPDSYTDNVVADYLLFTPPTGYQTQSMCQ